MSTRTKNGFTLIELLVTVAIIGVLASILFVALGGGREKARDAKRKLEIAQFGRFLSLGCYMPDGGGGEYDVAIIASELKIKYPQQAQFVANVPRDPKIGSESETFYKYIVSSDGKHCVLYTNLENENEQVTLTSISMATPGGGTGVFQAGSLGWNDTDKYFQVGY